MKKVLLWLMAAILICGTTVFTACTNDDNPAVDSSSTLALIVKNGDIEYFQQIESAFRNACKENNLVAAYFATTDENAWQEQVDAVNKLRSLSGTKLKGIIYAPCKGPNGECADAAVADLAKDLGIPVVILDSKVNEGSPLVNCPFFGIDNTAAGSALAQQVTADKIASFGIITSPGAERANGFMKLKPNTTFTEIPENSSEQVQAAMDEYQTFVFMNGSALYPSFSFLKDSGKEVYTFDIYESFLDELIAGSSWLKGIMVQNTFEMTRKAVDAVLTNAQEGEMVPTFFMTQDNLNDSNVKPFLEFYNKTVPAPIENLAEKLIGKWMDSEADGQPALTNEKSVVTFISPTKAIYSTSKTDYTESQPKWSVHRLYDVNISGNMVTLTGHPEGNPKITLQEEYFITAITATEIVCKYKHTTFHNGQSEGTVTEKKDIRLKKIDVDYRADVLGIWECKAITGGDTFNDDNARLEFKTDGTYNFYRKTDGGQWQAVTTREFQDYFVDGMLLDTRWKNQSEAEMREWWEIKSINGDKMVWTALRQNGDGSTFEQTVEWERVES